MLNQRRQSPQLRCRCGTPLGFHLAAHPLPRVSRLPQLLQERDHLSRQSSTCPGELLLLRQICTLSGNALVFHICGKCHLWRSCNGDLPHREQTAPTDRFLLVATPPLFLVPGGGLPLLGLPLCTVPTGASGSTAPSPLSTDCCLFTASSRVTQPYQVSVPHLTEASLTGRHLVAPLPAGL